MQVILNSVLYNKKNMIETNIFTFICDGYYMYAQKMHYDSCTYAFFDYRSKGIINDYSILSDVPILFIIAIHKSVPRLLKFKKIGKLSLREDFLLPPLFYIVDNISKNFFVYNALDGTITPSDKKQCKGLECAAVWEDNHVLDRIKDYYEGRECVWLKEDKEIFSD